MFVQNCSQRINRAVYSLMVLIAAVLFTSACQYTGLTSRPPNKNELEAFVKVQAVNPIVDKLLDDSLVLLYENSTSFGCYTLTIHEPGGTLATRNVSVAKSEQPILVIEQLTTASPFMAVVIQDAALSAETAAIDVTIDSQNHLGATTNGRPGAILVSPSPVKDWKTVTLYNAQGSTLYNQGGHSLQQLRVLNTGSENIQNLTILFPGPTSDAAAIRVEFGNVPAGQLTDYRNVASGVYRYSAFSYTLERRVINQAVMDWIGESPMRGAKFTYHLALHSQKMPGDQMQLVEVLIDEP